MKCKKIDHMDQTLLIAFILMINIMKVIRIGTIPFNMALSDFLLPLLGVLLILRVKTEKFKNVFFMWQWAVILILWLIFTGIHAMLTPEISTGSIRGVAGELIKTVVSIAYFYVGFNALKIIEEGTFKKFWFISSGLFIVMGIFFVLIAKIPSLATLVDSRYQTYFMGTYTDPNHAATFLGINTFLFFNFSMNEEKRVLRILYLFMGMISSFLILLTDSRGGLIALALAYICFGVIHFKKLYAYWQEISLALWGMILMVFNLDHIISQNTFISRFYYSFVNFEGGLGVRDALRQTAWEMALDHPFLGVGRGNYSLNSMPYFEKLHFNYIDNIPHNTYVGLFAELGIVGIILFSIPLFAVLFVFMHKFRRSDSGELTKRWLSVLVPVMIIVSVQAFILNVENQRVLWFLLGMFLYFSFYTFESEATIVAPMAYMRTKKNISKKILIAVLLIVLTFISRNNFYVNLQGERVADVFIYTLPLRHLDPNVAFELNYQIKVSQKGFNQHGVEMRLKEHLSSGEVILLDQFLYTPISGNEKLTFKKTEKNSYVTLELKNINLNLDGFYVKPISLKVDDQIVFLDRMNLMMRNTMLETPLRFMFMDREESVEVSIHPLGDVQMDDYFTFDFVSHEQFDTFDRIKYKITALKMLPYRTTFLCYGVPDDVSILMRSEMPSGVRYFPSDTPSVFDTIYEHQVVYLSYDIPRDAQYQLRFRGYYIKDEKGILLKEKMTQKSYIELGIGE